ncbi:DNA-directed RNA polymerase subunit beta [Mammaliicoccus vitulinus]|uniref:DNA-directed RNA polymerase subunit beta n=1 Tax=Mammaliicoccus vitulinus TaxID=71237 RepID=A0ABX7HC56_9STAP|nr:DNA-directed RNA polymerase subunit beta [Mammaliicoccus vitulinus]PNZ40648.1 DNA-directed RNA polymerase subunit beta [Mammaliicoccus vitulinus]QRO84211.1 DNA-directed RNA polymerase subunit beta [Mammaliicoccus vitulinus]
MTETQSSRSDNKQKKSPYKNFKEKIQKNRVETIQGVDVEHRVIPLWIKLLILLVLMILLFIVGTMIGYGILHNPFGVFNPETWQHIFDLTGRSS